MMINDVNGNGSLFIIDAFQTWEEARRLVPEINRLPDGCEVFIPDDDDRYGHGFRLTSSIKAKLLKYPGMGR